MSRKEQKRIGQVAAFVITLLLCACSTNRPRPTPEMQTPAPSPASSVGVDDKPAPKANTEAPEPATPWQRMRDRLLTEDCQTRASVLQETRRFLRDPDVFQSAWREAMPFLMFVVGEIERRNLPGEIALVPFVESRYRPLPGSGQGAAGIWQLVPRTARSYGLEVSNTYDARLDVVESTRAALELFEHLEREFSDWRLAFLAYNAGEFRLKRALGKGGSREISRQSMDTLALSRTTHQFLDRIEALACIIRQPELHEAQLPDPGPADQPQLIHLEGPVDIQLAAALANMPVEALARLNPGWERRTASARKSFQVLLPANVSEAFIQRLALIPSDVRAHWKRVRVADVMDLESFAGKGNFPIELLASANPAANDRALQVGEVLLVPDPDARASLRRSAQDPATHVVQQGDSLWRLAQSHGVSVKQLREWNGLHPGSILKLGMRLLIRAPEY